MTGITGGPFAHINNKLPLPETKEKVVKDGALPKVFQFSQQSLQDYSDCSRRFQLRYINAQRWPAATSEPIEKHERYMQLGEQFHLLVQQQYLGIDTDALTPDDYELSQWWDDYLRFPPADLPTGKRLPEIVLSTPVGDQRLLARFDLLAIDPGTRMVIIDWKTTRRRPTRETLLTRRQTMVYLYVLAEAGDRLFGGPVRPDQISLVYWFTVAPTNPEVFTYSEEMHEQFKKRLHAEIKEITKRDGVPDWELTPNRHQCEFCVYRSLCDRGVYAGALDESTLEFGEGVFDFDLDSVEEVAF